MTARAAGIAVILLACCALPAQARTVWLCKPGATPNPCTSRLGTTVVSQKGRILGTRAVRRARPRPIDCFYVYPTVSAQPTRNSNLRIEPEQRAIARLQAARYSQLCRVYAPMYRQQTIAALGSDTPITAAETRLAYRGVRGAWRQYLRRYNDGRGFVLIGHSQGSEVLRSLITREVDRRPGVRRQLLSAILLGGNVQVAKDRGVGGDFHNISACRSRRQLACVVAFSAFDGPVPEDAVYGRIGGPFSPGDPSRLDVLCANPAALGGGSGRMITIFPRRPGVIVPATGIPRPDVTTPYYELRGAYRARCSSAAGAHVLQVRGAGGTLTPFPDATWGIHLVEANLALGNLLALIRAEIAAWKRQKSASAAQAVD